MISGIDTRHRLASFVVFLLLLASLAVMPAALAESHPPEGPPPDDFQDPNSDPNAGGDFDPDVRKELVDEPALRLGGVGSFDDLLTQLIGDTGSGPTPGELAQLGWDQPLGDIAGVDFGEFVDPDDLEIDDDALEKALEAFKRGPDQGTL